MTAPRAPVPAEVGARNGQPAAMLQHAAETWATDPAGAEAWLRRAAAAWHLPARLELGRRLLAGEGLTPDEAEGRSILASIAVREPAAAVLLFDLDADVPGPFDDRARARLRKAGEAGDEEAWYELGMRLWAEGGANRVPLAREAFQAAAREGHGAAMYRLAEAIRVGMRGSRGGGDALRELTDRHRYWLEQAADRGVAEAMEDLAGIGGRAAPTLPAEAQAWRRRAAEAGSAVAAFGLAQAAYAGEDAPFDLGEARRWLRLAAKAGHGPAAELLATVFDPAPGEPDDPTVRRAWLGASARASHAPAFMPLAHMLAAGDGGPADPLAAAGWYDLAARLGSVEAASAAARLRLRAGADLRADPAALRSALVAVDRVGEAGGAARVKEAEGDVRDAIAPLEGAFGSLTAARMALADRLAGGQGVPVDLAGALAWYLAAGEDLDLVPEVAVPALLAAARLLARSRVVPAERFPTRAPGMKGCIPEGAVAVPDAGALARRAAGWVLAQAGVEPGAGVLPGEAPSAEPLVQAAWRVWRRDLDGHRRDGLGHEEALARFEADLAALEAQWSGEAPALGGGRAAHPGDAPALGG